MAGLGPRRWLRTRILAVLPILLLVVAACTAGGRPSAFPVGSVRTTGPLFLSGAGSHGCTASVIASPRHNLLITAGHCFWGTGRGMTFVPGSVNGSAPYGRWTVTAAYADPSWVSSRNPLRDVAILTVAPQFIDGGFHEVQDLTGGNRLVTTPASLGAVVVPAYLDGVGGSPISCIADTYRTGVYTAFDCNGYANGVSGAPFVSGSAVIGVIGGLHQGGCFPQTSYSSPFDASTIHTYDRAVSGAPSDSFPTPGPDGC